MPSRAKAPRPYGPRPSARKIKTVEEVAEKLLNDLGLVRESFEGLTEAQIRLKVMMALAGAYYPEPNLRDSSIADEPVAKSEEEARSRDRVLRPLPPNVDEELTQWFLREVGGSPPGRALRVDTKSEIVLEFHASKELDRIRSYPRNHLPPDQVTLVPFAMFTKALEWQKSEPASPPPLPRDTKPPGTENQDGVRVLSDEKSFMLDGVRYFPLSAAAPISQAPRSTLLHWIKKGTKINGQPLQSYHFGPANRYFLSEESIQRAAERFIKWPSHERAGPVTLGGTKDQSGYVGLAEAAETLGVDHHTVWLWATHGTAPTEEPLDVIKCPASDQFYIRETDISQLKKLVPRSGLRRGRRRQATPRPQ